jgi:hypothetical protein
VRVANFQIPARFPGRNLDFGGAGRQNDAARETELVDRVASSDGLTRGEATRVVDDVVAWFREPPASTAPESVFLH